MFHLRYAITAGTGENALTLAHRAAGWAAQGIDFIQLREPGLEPRELYTRAVAIQAALDEAHSKTKLLLNSRADIALAVGAAGIHLSARPGELTPAQVRTLYAHARLPPPVVSISCHLLEEVQRARAAEANLILLGPVFEKSVAGKLIRPGTGLGLLDEACSAAGPIPVLALGGVTRQNIAACLEAGAAGIAAIRLFA